MQLPRRLQYRDLKNSNRFNWAKSNPIVQSPFEVAFLKALKVYATFGT